MTIFLALREALAGWMKILRNEAGWRGHFRLTAPGLATAIALFYLFAFLAVVVSSMQYGVPTPGGFVEVMFVQSLWLVALLGGVYGTRLALKTREPVLQLLVPGTYALIAYLVIGTLLTLTLGMLLPLLWLALGYLFYRLARVAAAWNLGISIAFAALTTVLLVGLPMTLYMLATLPAPAA